MVTIFTVDKPSTFPFDFGIRFDQTHCKLVLHYGTGTIEGQEAAQELQAQFIVPPQGDCLILLKSAFGNLPSLGIATGLRIVGSSDDGPFSALCPQFRIKSASVRRFGVRSEDLGSGMNIDLFVEE